MKTLLVLAIEAGYGCWYCKGNTGADLEFSFEFDTPVHVSCAKKALEKDENNVEAEIIVRELAE